VSKQANSLDKVKYHLLINDLSLKYDFYPNLFFAYLFAQSLWRRLRRRMYIWELEEVLMMVETNTK